MRGLRRSGTWLLLLALLLTGLALPVQAEGKADTMPVMVVAGVPMLPVRAAAEAAGVQVAWDGATSTVSLQAEGISVQLTVGDATAQVGGQPVALAAPVTLQDGRLYAPAGFLLTVLGGRLNMASPALIDAEAMRLLARSQKVSPADLDLDMEQSMTFTLATPTQASMAMTMSLRAQARGNDLLAVVTTRAPQLPVAGTTTMIAVRGGRIFVPTPTGWQEVKLSGALQQAAQALSGPQALLSLVQEAHLGAQHWVAGQPYQDVSITLSPAALQALVAPLLQAALPSMPGLKVSIAFDSAAMTITIDPASGRAVSDTTDMAMRIAAVAGSGGMRARVVLHQVRRLHPDSTPITWPADLPR